MKKPWVSRPGKEAVLSFLRSTCFFFLFCFAFFFMEKVLFGLYVPIHSPVRETKKQELKLGGNLETAADAKAREACCLLTCSS